MPDTNPQTAPTIQPQKSSPSSLSDSGIWLTVGEDGAETTFLEGIDRRPVIALGVERPIGHPGLLVARI